MYFCFPDVIDQASKPPGQPAHPLIFWEQGQMGLIARKTTVLLGGASLFIAAGMLNVAAQDAATDEQIEAEVRDAASRVTFLDTITVVSRTDETAMESLASVSQISGEQLERRMASTPNGVLFGVPGVVVQADERRAASSANIRGLQEFGRVAVIVDGARQNFQRSDHGTQSQFFIDPELIKQVDVIRGPVANTYGSGAIGGVVFFETKDASDFLRDGENWAVSGTGRYETNGRGWTTSATGAYRFTDAAEILANLVWRDFSDYKDGAGNLREATGFDVLSGMVKATIRPTENSELKLGWVGANDVWQEVNSDKELDVKQNTFTARYNLKDENESWLDLSVNLSANLADVNQTLLETTSFYHPVTGVLTPAPAGSATIYDLDTYGVDIWNTSRFDTGAFSHELTYGFDWLADKVNNVSYLGADDVYSPSGKRTVWGAHIQNKIGYDEWLEVIAGLRYDNYSLEKAALDNSGDRLSPRLTVGVTPFAEGALQGLQVYGTYAEGYRSPSVSETLMNGLHPSGVAFPFLPNPDLRPETAQPLEFGINYGTNDIFTGRDSLRVKAAYFHNDVDDYIETVTLSPFVPGSGCSYVPGPGRIPICYQYQNLANAKIRGFELESIYDAGFMFGGLNASIIRGHTISYDGVRGDLISTPAAQVTGTLGFRFLEERLAIGGEVQYNAKPKGAVSADDYTLVNVFASYKANENLNLNFRVDNLFDIEYANALNAVGTTAFTEPGVSLKFGATVRFGG